MVAAFCAAAGLHNSSEDTGYSGKVETGGNGDDICDDIGDASYDNQRVATVLIELLQKLTIDAPGLLPNNPLGTRYDLDAVDMTAEDYLIALAQKRHQGDIERTARQMLTDFRKGALGAIALEVRPEM